MTKYHIIKDGKRNTMKIKSVEYISIVEYAEMHGKESSTVRQKALRGGFKTARKIGRNWVIDKNEPYTDLRKK